MESKHDVVRMNLTRRDALLSLATTSIGFGGLSWSMGELADGTADASASDLLSPQRLDTVLAVAETVYPSAVEVEPSFAETYFEGQPDDRKEQFITAADDLDELTRGRTGEPFAAVSPSARAGLFREIGVGRAGSDPTGTLPERVRYYHVNGLLYALYTTPAGSSLFGISNPVGHPGGYRSYQEEP